MSLLTSIFHLLLLLSCITLTTKVTAQSTPPDDFHERFIYIEHDTIEDIKQSIYCDRKIRWAGIVDVDIIPNPKVNQSWDNFKESGYSTLNFKQYTTDSSPIDLPLMQHILEGIQNNKVEVYQTDSLLIFKDLEGKLHHPILNEGEKKHYYQASDFEILRLRCFLFYIEDNNGFELVPFAAVPIRTEYDVYSRDNQPFYLPLGWIPVTSALPKNKTWQKLIHSDVNLNNVRIFKQDWTFDQTIQNLIKSHQAPNSSLKLYDANNFQNQAPLHAKQLEEIITYEHIDFDPDTFDEITTRVPHEDLGLVGLNISMELVWDNSNHQLHIKPIRFSPIAHNMDLYCNDCEGENMYLFRLFSNKK